MRRKMHHAASFLVFFGGCLFSAAAPVVEVVHPFEAPPSGAVGGLVQGSDGLMWGTTSAGGANDKGTIFTFNPVEFGGGTRRYFEVVKSFRGGWGDGETPQGALVADGAGNLLGTTSAGGAAGQGTVYRIFSATGAFSTVAEFSGRQGVGPWGALIRDPQGWWWGTAR